MTHRDGGFNLVILDTAQDSGTSAPPAGGGAVGEAVVHVEAALHVGIERDRKLERRAAALLVSGEAVALGENTIVVAGAPVSISIALFQWVTTWSLLMTKVGMVLPSIICDRAI